jgi:hypothetical protein
MNDLGQRHEQIIREAKKASRLFRDPQARDRVLGEFNASTLDSVGPMGGDQGMAVLNEMNDLESGHDEFVKSVAPRVDVV